jgi:hypothetical protein
MDPDTNLEEQLQLAENMVCCEDKDARRLAKLVIELNIWVSRGGSLPGEWVIGKHFRKGA